MYHGNYKVKYDSLTFLLKRILRLSPPYWISIFLCILLWYLSAMVPGFLGKQPDISIFPVLVHFIYIKSFFSYTWLNPVFWTLEIEIQYYLWIALLFPLISNHNFWIRILTIVTFACLAFIIPSEKLLFHFLPCFTAGIVVFQFHRRLIGVFQLGLQMVILSLVSVLVLGPIISCVTLLSSLIICFLKLNFPKQLIYLGTISYSLYLVHVPIGGKVVNLGTRFAHNVPVVIMVLGLAVVFSLIAAHLLYYIVERPSQRWSAAIKYKESESLKSSSISG